MDSKAIGEETPAGLLNIDDFDSLLGFALQSATSTEGVPHYSGPANEVRLNWKVGAKLAAASGRRRVDVSSQHKWHPSSS